MSDCRDESEEQTKSTIDVSAGAIAVVGAACHYPGGCDDLDALWRLLCEARSGIGLAPAGRGVDVESRYGGFLAAPFPVGFDASFFGISPVEAQRLDPQQRLLLETSWRALESAGIVIDPGKEHPIGVFVAISTSDFQQIQSGLHAQDAARQFNATGASFAAAAGRLSYCFGFTGPSLAVDTACSSSLVAFHLACQAIRSGECEAALVAGVNALLTQDLFTSLGAMNLLSPDGQARPFGLAANGYVRAEGCGSLVLKPLDQALRDGDDVFAVCRGSAVNHGGRTNGLTAPSSTAQQRVIEAALKRADLTPSDVDYVEAHGTGTPLGDSIELNALAEAYAATRRAEAPLLVGSIKANIGHLEAGAGMAGLIKTILCLKHGKIPAQAEASALTREIAWDKTAMRVPDTRMSWPVTGRPRRAGVSSFGFGGTNAHVIIEAFETANNETKPTGAVVLPISARTPSALAELSLAIGDWLETSPRDLRNVSYTLGARRTVFACRRAVVGASAAELAGLLRGSPAAEPGDDPQRAPLLQQAAQWTAGGDVDFARLARAAGGRCVAMPGHPFHRENHGPGDEPDPAATAPAVLPSDQEGWRDLIGENARTILGGKTGMALDAERPLADQGFTSLLGLELRRDLEKLSGRTLPATFFYNYPSVGQMADYFVLPSAGFEVSRAKASADDESCADADFVFLDKMSDAELMAFIDREVDM
jgi:acyl transferase domain-containing protein